MNEIKDPNASGIVPRLSVLMFLQFWIWGAWYISIPTYLGLEEHKYMGSVIFYCFAAMPLAAMFAPFFLGLVADRFFNTEKVLFVLFLLGGISLLSIPAVVEMSGELVQVSEGISRMKVTLMGQEMYSDDLLSWVILFHSLCFMPTLALTASLSFTHLPKGSTQFPIVRLWGTFGWIFGGAALMIFNSKDASGTVVPGEATPYQFYLAGGASVLLAFYCFMLPKTPAPKKNEKVDIGALFFLDVWKEFKNGSFFIFVLCSFLLCIPLQAYYAYLQSQMGTQGFVNVAFWKNGGTWLEAFMMFAMPFFFRKLGVKKMIAIGIGAWVLRYALFPLAANYGVMNPGGAGVEFAHAGFLLIMAGVLLHGICYDFFFVTGQIYVDQSTDKNIRGQAQSMIVFFTQGLGMFIGALLNQKLFMKAFEVDNVGAAYGAAGNPDNLKMWSSFWWPLCIGALVILIVFVLFFKHKDKEGAEFSH